MAEDILQATTNSQAATSSLLISPIFSDIQPGKYYILNLENRSEHPITVQLEPAVFEILGSERRIYPNELTTIEGQPLTTYLQTEASQLTLQAAEKKSLKINYLKAAEGYLLGVKVKSGNRTNSKQTQVNTEISGASVILKTELTQAKLAAVKTKLEVRPEYGVSVLGWQISLTNNYSVRTTIENESDLILKPSGVVTLYTNDKRIESTLLTPELIKGLYPTETFTTQRQLNDKRQFWQQLGSTEVKQEVTINSNELVDKANIYVVPYQLVLLVVAILSLSLTFYLGYFIWRRRSAKPSHKVKYSHGQDKSKIGKSKYRPGVN